jgi:hypothetical protein
MRPSHRIVALLCAALTACAAPTPAARAPVRAEVRHFAGSVLTGPTAEPAPAELAADALGLRLKIALVEGPLAGDVLPARLIVQEAARDPFAAHSVLAEGARLSVGAAPSESEWATHVEDALLRGGTAVLALEPDRRLAQGPRPPWQRLELELSRRADGAGPLSCALALESPPMGAGAPLRERIVLDAAPELGGPAWRLAFPAPSATSGNLMLTVEVQVVGAASPAAAERAMARREAARRASELETAALSADEDFRVESASALQALARRDLQRPALLYLAEATRAELLIELALVLDAQTLSELLQTLREHLAAQPGELAAADLGWALESASWRWLLELASADDARDTGDEPRVPAVLRALLLERAGEAGRWPDLALDALDESGDAQALAARFERENLIFLEDADPAARVRAWDWLAARGLAPAGFDPLASSAERRAALALVRAAEEASAEPER